MKRPRIAVLGSANIDLVCRVPTLPRPGETLRASSVSRFRGGKGANQAVGAARLGADVSFFGMVGDDTFGSLIRSGFEENGVDASSVEQLGDVSTGAATIWVAESGENAIVIAGGANDHVDPHYVDQHLEKIWQADVLLLQFEIPMKTIAHVLRSLPPEKPAVFLDPAPARSFEAIDVSRLACVTPNEEELLALSGTSNLDHGTQILQELGVELVVCTLGESGAYALRRNGEAVRCPAFKVDAVDSTASGDAFTAALAVAWASGGHDVEQMLRWACAAGAIAATRAGAWPSLPTEQEVLSLLRR